MLNRIQKVTNGSGNRRFMSQVISDSKTPLITKLDQRVENIAFFVEQKLQKMPKKYPKLVGP